MPPFGATAKCSPNLKAAIKGSIGAVSMHLGEGGTEKSKVKPMNEDKKLVEKTSRWNGSPELAAQKDGGINGVCGPSDCITAIPLVVP